MPGHTVSAMELRSMSVPVTRLRRVTSPSVRPTMRGAWSRSDALSLLVLHNLSCLAPLAPGVEMRRPRSGRRIGARAGTSRHGFDG